MSETPTEPKPKQEQLCLLLENLFEEKYPYPHGMDEQNYYVAGRLLEELEKLGWLKPTPPPEAAGETQWYAEMQRSLGKIDLDPKTPITDAITAYINVSSKALHAAKAREELLTSKLAEMTKEREEAISAHGVVWNAVRKANSAFRWLDTAKEHPSVTEEINACIEAEKLTPKWSTDWAIIGRMELKSLRSALTAKTAEAEGLRGAMDKIGNFDWSAAATQRDASDTMQRIARAALSAAGEAGKLNL